MRSGRALLAMLGQGQRERVGTRDRRHTGAGDSEKDGLMGSTSSRLELSTGLPREENTVVGGQVGRTLGEGATGQVVHSHQGRVAVSIGKIVQDTEALCTTMRVEFRGS